MTKTPKNGHGGNREGSGRPPLTEAEKAARRAARKAKKAAEAQRAKIAAEPRRRRVRDPADFERLAEIMKVANRRRRPFQAGNSPFRLSDINKLHPPIAVPPAAVWDPAKSPMLGLKGHIARLAMDSAAGAWAAGSWMTTGTTLAASEGQAFLGYPYLSELAQRPEYRVIAETIADDATRKWIDFEITGTEQEIEDRQEEDAEDPKGARERRETRVKNKDKTDKVKQLKDMIEQTGLRDEIYQCCRNDGFFGRSHLYMDFGVDLDGAGNDELTTPIGDGRGELSKGKIAKGSLRGFRTIEPVWTYPMTYNAVNPLRADWYNPQVWYVLGKQIHVSRLPVFIGHPVPDLLKPSYSFGGISLSQMAQPYVDIWLQTRQAVAQLIHSFSIMVLSTDMQQDVMPNQSGGLIERAAEFNLYRDNMGLWIVNKETEEFSNVSAPLSGLEALQAQSQEHMCSVVRIPVMKFTGISPTGMNASSEGEIRAYYDTIAAYQNRFIRPNLTKILYFMMLSLWGEVDPEITFIFEPLWEMSEKERADLQKTEIERDQLLVDMGVISPEEERQRIVDDPHLPFSDLDPEDMPELKQEEEEGLVPGEGGKGLEAILGQPGAEGGPGGPGAPGGAPGGPGGPAGGNGPLPNNGGGGQEAKNDNEVQDPAFRKAAADEALDPLFRGAGDAFEWLEDDHPREEHGKFTSKGGGAGGTVIHQHFTMPQFGLTNPPQHQHSLFEHGMGGASWKPEPPKPLDPRKMKRVGPQMGSNPGGVFEDEKGRKFYIKEGRSKDHVRNELTAAALMQLAGGEILNYRPVEGGNHIATEMEKLTKKNAHDFSPEEVRRARRDFAAHAWIANYDAVGTGGDNLVTIGGTPVEVDLGGALEYRAQGKPKGDTFGAEAKEIDSMRDPSIAPDASKIFGGITPAEFSESARRVTRVSDAQIHAAVEGLGGKPELADKLIKRRDDIARRAKMFGADGDPKKKTSTVVFAPGADAPKELNGVKFEPWKPPADGDWNDVDGQIELGEDDLPERVKGKQLASGVIMREKDGRTWLMKPKGGFGGYEGTFPKGRVEPGLSMQANAIKEAYEETGLKANITGLAGDHEGDVTFTRYYVAERAGGDPADLGEESDAVVLAPKDKLDGFLNRDRDRKIVKALGADHAFASDWEEGKHPRGNTKNKGQFAKGSGGGGAGKPKPGAKPQTDLERYRAQRGPQSGDPVKEAAELTGGIPYDPARGLEDPTKTAAKLTGGKPIGAKGSNLVARQSAAGPGRERVDYEKVFGKQMAAQVAALKPKEEKGFKKHVDRVRKLFSSDEARKATKGAVTKWATKHAAGVAQHHITTAMLMPVLHHTVEAAVENIGLATIPGATLGATAVAAYAVHQIMEHYELTVGGAAELIIHGVRSMIDVLGGVKEVAARVASLEKAGTLAGDDADEDEDSVLDSLILLLLELEEINGGGDEPDDDDDDDDDDGDGGEGGAEDAAFEESKHPRDKSGKFAESAGGGENSAEAEEIKAKAKKAQPLGTIQGPEEDDTEVSVFANSSDPGKVNLVMFDKESGNPVGPVYIVKKDDAQHIAHQMLHGPEKAKGVDPKQADKLAEIFKKDKFLGKNVSSDDVDIKHNDDGSVTVSIRYLGEWKNPPGEEDEEDYDWQEPTGQTEKAVTDAVANFEKSTGLKVKVSSGEKNYTYFDIAPAAAKEEPNHNALAEKMAETGTKPDQDYEDFKAKVDAMISAGNQAGAAELAKANPEHMKKLETDDPQMAGEIGVGEEMAVLDSAESKVIEGLSAGLGKAQIEASLTEEQAEALASAHGGVQPAIADIEAVTKKASAKKTMFGGLWKTTGKSDKEDIQYNAGLVAGKKDIPGGQSYRQMIAYLIKKGPEAGLTNDQVDQLKGKMLDALAKAKDKAITAGNTKDAAKISAALAKIKEENPHLVGGAPPTPESDAMMEMATENALQGKGVEALEAALSPEQKAAVIEQFGSLQNLHDHAVEVNQEIETEQQNEQENQGGPAATAAPTAATEAFNEKLKSLAAVLNVGSPSDVASKKSKLAATVGASAQDLIDNLTWEQIESLKDKYGSVANALAAKKSDVEAEAAQTKATGGNPIAGSNEELVGAIKAALGFMHKGAEPLNAEQEEALAAYYGNTEKAFKSLGNLDAATVKVLLEGKSDTGFSPGGTPEDVKKFAPNFFAAAEKLKAKYGSGSLTSAQQKAQAAATNDGSWQALEAMLTPVEKHELNKLYGDGWAQKAWEDSKEGTAPNIPVKSSEIPHALVDKLKEINEQHKVSSWSSTSKKIMAAVKNGITDPDVIKSFLKQAELKKVEAKKGYGGLAGAVKKFDMWYGPKSPTGVAQAAAVAKAAVPETAGETPTEAELTKAKKSVPLQLQYVPNAPSTPEAQKLVDKFNEKWANKEIPDNAKAYEKIADFKKLKQDMIPLMTEAQKNAAKSAEEQKKIAAEAVQKAAAQAKAEAEKHKEQNKKYMADLGISEAEAEGFDGLVKMMGGHGVSIAEFKDNMKSQANKFAKEKMSGFEASLIANYKSSSSYVNEEMRKAPASWGEEQWAYSKVLNNALAKLPGYNTNNNYSLTRNTPLDADIQARYTPGHIVMEHGFTGTSKDSVFNGNTRFHVKAIGKRAADISAMYGFGSEQEVLFRAHTAFRVDKVEGSPGQSGNATYRVWMTEVEY